MDINNKFNNSLKLTSIIKSVFRSQKTLKKPGIKLYSTLALPALLYGTENWTIKARETIRIMAAKMAYVRKTAGYTWTDYKTNTEIAKELKYDPSFGQNTGIQKKLVAMCKQNAMY